MYYYYKYKSDYSYIEAIIFVPHEGFRFGSPLEFNNIQPIKIFKSKQFKLKSGARVSKKYCKLIDEPNNIMKNLV